MAENSDRIMADQIPSPGREPGLTLEEWRDAPRLLTGDARHLPQVDLLAVDDQSRRIAHQAGFADDARQGAAIVEYRADPLADHAGRLAEKLRPGAGRELLVDVLKRFK